MTDHSGWGRGTWGEGPWGQSTGVHTTVTVDQTTATAATGTVTVTSVRSPTATADPTTASTTAPVPTVVARNPTTITTTAAGATSTTETPTVSTTKAPTIGAGTATATATTPAPAVYPVHDTTVGATSTTATAQAPAPAVYISATITTSAAHASAPAATVTVTSQQHTTATVDPAPAATTATPVPTVDGDVNGLAVVDTATATAVTPYAAPNPSHITVTADSTQTTTATPVPAVEMRYPTRITSTTATATATAVDPGHVEAVDIITSLPGAIEGKGVTAETTATISPDVDLEGSSVEPRAPANKHYRESITTDRPEFADANQRSFATDESSVYTPERRLYINGEEITVDRDIDISAGEYGYVIADIELYNLDIATWNEIGETDRVEIELGWRQGETQRVFDGEVLIKRRRTQRHNRAYVLRAQAHGGGIVTGTYNRTFNRMSPHRIAEHIAMDIDGLTPGYIATGSDRLDSAYTLSRSKELGDWLDRLATKARKQTGTRWVWYLEDQELAFHPIDEQVTDHIELGMDKSVVRATPIGFAETDPSAQTHELVMRCEPILERGVAVTVSGADGIDPVNLYRIVEYTHDSATTTGRHHTTAVIAPLHKKIEYPTHY